MSRRSAALRIFDAGGVGRRTLQRIGWTLADIKQMCAEVPLVTVLGQQMRSVEEVNAWAAEHASPPVERQLVEHSPEFDKRRDSEKVSPLSAARPVFLQGQLGWEVESPYDVPVGDFVQVERKGGGISTVLVTDSTPRGRRWRLQFISPKPKEGAVIHRIRDRRARAS